MTYHPMTLIQARSVAREKSIDQRDVVWYVYQVGQTTNYIPSRQREKPPGKIACAYKSGKEIVVSNAEKSP